MLLADLPPGQLQLWIIVAYLAALILLGVASTTVFKGTAVDYFVASRGVGPVLLVLSVFGTTMTAFAIQGSSGEAWKSGVGVYGKMASWSGIVHAACFFLVGAKLWSLGKRYGYQTQIQFFRDRLESRNIGVLLFPILALLQMPYIILGILGAGTMIGVATRGAFPHLFPMLDAAGAPMLGHGAVPFWLATLVCTAVVWLYVWLGGARATAWANGLQTIIFLIVGVVTFYFVADRLGGFSQATKMVQEYNPSKLTRAVTAEHQQIYEQRLAEWTAYQGRGREGAVSPTRAAQGGGSSGSGGGPEVQGSGEVRGSGAAGADRSSVGILKPHKPKEMTELEFLSYGFIPLSVAMFPHLFQLWLTARSAKSFRLTVTLHPLLIMLIWAPCIAIGIWATSAIAGGKPIVPFTPDMPNANANQVLGLMVASLKNPYVSGLLAAGVLAAILGGMDAQFLSLGSMFTHDVVDHYVKHDAMTDRQRLLFGRLFVIAVVLASWVLTLALRETKPIFGLAIWCFSGFSALFPLVIGALYWRRMTKWGGYASVIAGIGLGVYYYVKAGLEAGFSAPMEPLVPLPGLGHAWAVVPACPMVLAATAALVLVSLLTRPPTRSTVVRFFPAG
ncbi:MAG: sodium:solute symporter family protein [Phycisphaerae bacterium]|nr:sodium:solute symporter family protein [Planctomycetia bacterium]MCL4717367.1 sodium:solute symporter family protein [Phycisphaerae bacterium]